MRRPFVRSNSFLVRVVPRRAPGRVAAVLFLLALGPSLAAAGAVDVAAGVDHAEWDRFLRIYVDERGLIAYGKWKASATDRPALALYLERLGEAPKPAAAGRERIASLVNAYNAFTVSWILDNYPTRGIRYTFLPFGRRRHRLGGRLVSLDEIEHDTLRRLAGYRVHAALVCAARSCPPLAREAYRADAIDVQLDRAMERWLARPDLNELRPSGGARLSSIFRWFREDFDRAGGVREVVLRHGGDSARRALSMPDARIEYLDYDWSLNDDRTP